MCGPCAVTREPSDWLDRIEKIIPWLGLLLCAATRYYRIREPPGAC